MPRRRIRASFEHVFEFDKKKMFFIENAVCPSEESVNMSVCACPFKEHHRKFILLSRPSQSPDLDPIQNLRNEMEREVRQLDLVLSILEALDSAQFIGYGLKFFLSPINKS
ncbi:hypothetical protein TNCV_2104681 [Trichonephila clavipes]|nr:hypothetical protein TNCV_2104681 [Trichonephila clavipes]